MQSTLKHSFVKSMEVNLTKILKSKGQFYLPLMIMGSEAKKETNKNVFTFKLFKSSY